MTTLLGVDEAGRGAVIGPLVIAGIKIDEKDEPALKKLGVKDSKLLTRVQRERLYPEILKMIKDHVVIKITAKEIDELRKTINLNKIEAVKTAEIIKIMKADKAIIDAPQVSVDKYRIMLESLSKTKTKIVCENYADVNHPACSAASIIAKVERDWEVDEIAKKVGYNVGVGYPHDEKTIDFLKKALKEKKHLEYIRFSWATVEELMEKKEQKSLKEFKSK